MKLFGIAGLEIHFELRHWIIGVEYDEDLKQVYVWPLPMIVFIIDR